MMTTQSANLDTLWKDARFAAFWDRPDLTYTQWRGDIQKDAGDILEQSMLYVPCRSFIMLVGKDVFIQRYPTWREKVFPPLPTNRPAPDPHGKLFSADQPHGARVCLKNGALDAIWSALTSGSIYTGTARLQATH